MERASGRVREGRAVYSVDGHRMGRVVAVTPTAFEVEYGFFFPKDFVVSFDELLEATDERVTLRLPKAELLREWRRLFILGDAPRAPTREPPAGLTL